MVLHSGDRLQAEIAFMKSCRGAVKANQRLELAEMRRLLADMSTIENPWECVHGRPTVLKMDISQLDDHFGRLGEKTFFLSIVLFVLTYSDRPCLLHLYPIGP